MMNKCSWGVVMLGMLGMMASVPVLHAQSSPARNVLDSITYAKMAVEHGSHGHTGGLVKHAEKSRNYAKRGGNNPHLTEGITHLNEAIEHGKAGHADVATQHLESALVHLTEVQ